MKDWSEYTLADWRRLRPLLHAYKTRTYRAVNAWYVRRKAAGAAQMVESIHSAGGSSLAVTIAYETPWIVAEQIAAVRSRLDATTLVVCDNSRSDGAAADIARICASAGIAYLRLPRNPRKTGSRSHALGMNWAYRNIICAARPRCFAFLDHDLIPLREVDLADLVSRQPFYGHVRTAGHRWFLWAGYCVFDGRFADRPVLDFSQDWFIGLDTGGANFRRVYHAFDRGRMSFARYSLETIADPQTGARIEVEFVDDWLHLTNVSGWDQTRLHEPAALKRLIAVADRP